MSEERRWIMKIAMEARCFCFAGPFTAAIIDLVAEDFLNWMGGSWFCKTEKAWQQ